MSSDAANVRGEVVSAHAGVQAATPWPAAAKGWYAVAVLTLAYIVSFVDRTIISLLTEPIKADLHLTDTQLSLLQGAAFGLFYCAAGLPFGWLIDRTSRRRVIIGGITIWCLATSACGLAQNFWHMFIARMGVGAGEATLSPGAASIISDNFPPERRALPLAVYSSAASFGAGLALVLGSAVIAIIASRPQMTLPVIGAVANWQAVFIMVGAVGLTSAALMFTVAEPVRRANSARLEVAAQPRESLFSVLRKHPAFFGFLIGGFSLFTCMTYAVLSWVPASFIRTYGWTPQEVGARYGIVLLICGPLGAIFGGWLSGRLRRRGVIAADAWVSGLSMLGTSMLVGFSITAPTGEQAILRFAPTFFCFVIPAGLALSALQEVVAATLRGQIAAVYFLVMGVLGLLIGPTSVALLTDYVFKDPAALPKAIALVALCFSGSGGLMVLASIRPLRRMTSAS